LAATTMTTLDSAIQTKFVKKLLEKVKGKMAFPKFASNRKMEQGAGDTVRFNRVRRIPRQTTFNLSEDSTSVTEQGLTTDYIEATIGFVGDSLKSTRAAQITSILQDSAYMDEVSDQITRTMEYLGLKEISRYSIKHRVDNDTTYEANANVTTATSTTVAVSTDLTQSDNHWGESTTKVGYLVGTNPEGANYGIARLCTDFVASSDTLTTTAFPQNNTTDTDFHLTRGTALAATDVMTTTAIARVAGIHEVFQSKKFGGGTLRGFIDPQQMADLYNDTTFTTIMKYVEGMKQLGQYKVFRVFGVEFVVLPDTYREDVDGTENAAGLVHNAPIFGADTYNITKWETGQDDYGVKVNFIQKPDSGNYWGLVWWLNWHAKCAIATLEACNIVTLMTGVTALPATLAA